MKKENKKISIYNRVRSGLYSHVEQSEKKRFNRLVAASLATLLLASVLLFSAALVETSAGKHVYVFGEYEQKISNDQAYSGKILLIDMNTLANYCGFEQSYSTYEASFSINGTKATFTDGESKALINGIEIEMPANASIQNGYCLIPASSASELLYGVDISVGKSNTVITIDKDTVYMIAKEPTIKYETDMSEYLEYLYSKDEYIFTLANKENPLDRDFPEDKDSLIEIPAKYRKDSVIYLYKVAEKALEAMMNDMFSLGYNDVYVTSAYRSYAYQEVLFNMYIDREMEGGLSYDAAVQKVMTYSSEPGKSEHQTGLCVDFTTKSIGGVVDDDFETTAVFSWLKNNAWKYGFILRYAKDKEPITGYTYESWHYRFVGVEKASIIHQTGICYEEYLEIFEN